MHRLGKLAMCDTEGAGLEAVFEELTGEGDRFLQVGENQTSDAPPVSV